MENIHTKFEENLMKTPEIILYYFQGGHHMKQDTNGSLDQMPTNVHFVFGEGGGGGFNNQTLSCFLACLAILSPIPIYMSHMAAIWKSF